MCGYFSVDITQCSPHIEIDGNTCHSDFSLTTEDYEFSYLGVPPLDENGCYSISFSNNTGGLTMAGFGVNDALFLLKERSDGRGPMRRLFECMYVCP